MNQMENNTELSVAVPMFDAVAVPSQFEDFKKEAAELMAKAKTIKVTDPTQVSLMREAGEARKQLKKVRTSVENRRVQLGEDAKNYKQAVDKIAKEIREAIEPIEEYLEQQEKYAENLEKLRKAELKAKRVELLSPYSDCSLYDLENMPEDIFQNTLQSAKDLVEKKQREEDEAEEQRKEAIRINTLTQTRKNALIPYWKHLTAEQKEMRFGELDEQNWLHLVNICHKAEKEDQDRIAKEKADLAEKVAAAQKAEDEARKLRAAKAKADEENEKLKKEAKEREEKHAEELQKAVSEPRMIVDAHTVVSLEETTKDEAPKSVDLFGEPIPVSKGNDSERLGRIANEIERMIEVHNDIVMETFEGKKALSDINTLLRKVVVFAKEKAV